MIERDPILCPTDFSRCAGGALAYAVELAARTDATLHLLHVDDAGDADGAVHEARLREALQARAALLPSEARARLNVVFHACQGSGVAASIAGYVERHGVRLVVMGTRGRQCVRRLLLGSVAADVLGMVDCDVLTVRTVAQGHTQRTWGRRILVPVDLFEAPGPVLHEARVLAAAFGGRLDVLFVIEPGPIPFFSAGRAGALAARLPELRELARRRLEALLEEAGGPVVPVVVHVAEGQPATQIAACVRRRQNDLIVMAARGPSTLKPPALGSVTERVVRLASCPVWILKHEACEALAAPAEMAGAVFY